MAVTASSVAELCRAARDASRALAALDSDTKNAALHAIADALEVRKVRVPLGVIAVVYEARPNVTIDAAALCLKSGNAIVLRGSSSAAHSNAVLAAVAEEAAEAAGVPEGAIALDRARRRRRS